MRQQVQCHYIWLVTPADLAKGALDGPPPLPGPSGRASPVRRRRPPGARRRARRGRSSDRWPLRPHRNRRRAPDVLASAPHAATLLQLAVLAGRRSTVELLLDSGIDVNKPAPLFPLIFVTPLCA